MGCTGDLVLDNIAWRLESLTTHTDPDSTIKNFSYTDRYKLSGEAVSGMTRCFSIDWGPRENDGGVTDLAIQQSQEDCVLRVAYFKDGDWLTLQQLIRRDAFDIVKHLRNPDNWVGTSDANPSQNLGISVRWMVRDGIEETPHVAYLVQRWRHDLIEEE